MCDVGLRHERRVRIPSRREPTEGRSPPSWLHTHRSEGRRRGSAAFLAGERSCGCPPRPEKALERGFLCPHIRSSRCRTAHPPSSRTRSCRRAPRGTSPSGVRSSGIAVATRSRPMLVLLSRSAGSSPGTAVVSVRPAPRLRDLLRASPVRPLRRSPSGPAHAGQSSRLAIGRPSSLGLATTGALSRTQAEVGWRPTRA
jgi:hypothetical protein